MSKKITKQELMVSIAEAAVSYQRAEFRSSSLRRELNVMRATYFSAYGRPYADTNKRIDPDDDAFAGVIDFTETAYDRWFEARNLTTKLKRKMRLLVERLGRGL